MISIANGVWVAQLANVEGWVKFFRGATIDDQAVWVETFAREMEADDALQAVRALNIDAGELADVSQEIFATDELIYVGRTIYVAEEGETLIEGLGTAGEALLQAIAEGLGG
jgi:hypothetical protein